MPFTIGKIQFVNAVNVNNRQPSECVTDSTRSSRSATGWLVELAGDDIDVPLYLSVSTAKARFGWTGYTDQALMLARETDAEALAQYASARTPKGTRAIPRMVAWEQEKTDLERENARLHSRISDLESILSALRRIRTAAVERAEKESRSR